MSLVHYMITVGPIDLEYTQYRLNTDIDLVQTQYRLSKDFVQTQHLPICTNKSGKDQSRCTFLHPYTDGSYPKTLGLETRPEAENTEETAPQSFFSVPHQPYGCLTYPKTLSPLKNIFSFSCKIEISFFFCCCTLNIIYVQTTASSHELLILFPHDIQLFSNFQENQYSRFQDPCPPTQIFQVFVSTKLRFE